MGALLTGRAGVRISVIPRVYCLHSCILEGFAQGVDILRVYERKTKEDCGKSGDERKPERTRADHGEGGAPDRCSTLLTCRCGVFIERLEETTNENGPSVYHLDRSFLAVLRDEGRLRGGQTGESASDYEGLVTDLCPGAHPETDVGGA